MCACACVVHVSPGIPSLCSPTTTNIMTRCTQHRASKSPEDAMQWHSFTVQIWTLPLRQAWESWDRPDHDTNLKCVCYRPGASMFVSLKGYAFRLEGESKSLWQALFLSEPKDKPELLFITCQGLTAAILRTLDMTLAFIMGPLNSRHFSHNRRFISPSSRRRVQQMLSCLSIVHIFPPKSPSKRKNNCKLRVNWWRNLCNHSTTVMSNLLSTSVWPLTSGKWSN